MKWFVLTLFFASLIADTYIYRALIASRFQSFSARMAYIIFAVLTDGAALSALMLYGSAADRGATGVIAVMWLVWIFFLTLVPKVLYTVCGVLDYLAHLVLRRKIAVFKWLGTGLALMTMAVMVCGATAGRTKPRIEQIEVCSVRVPPGFDGYRIVQFSDVHIGTMLRPEKQIERLVKKIGELKGDMVVNTGDLVNLTHDELTPEVMEIFGRISAPDGVWSVWGNHDLGFYIREGASLTPEENFSALSEKVGRMGWKALSDSSTWIRRGVDSLLLTGLDYPRDRMLNNHNDALAGVDISRAFEGIGEAPFNVVLAHTPKLWDEITARGRGDVTLSGHVHAMQTKLRFLGRTWSPAQYLYNHWSGKYTSDGSKKNSMLYINDGIGCVGYPMRIGAQGEITVFTLKRCK